MRWIYLTSVWLHVLAAMTRVGGMVTFVVVMPFFRQHDEAVRSVFLHDSESRFRKVEWGSFAILAITGTFNPWMRGVDTHTGTDMTAVILRGRHSRYGRVWRERPEEQGGSVCSHEFSSEPWF